MERTVDRDEWEWRFVPRLLARSLLYPIRAGDPGPALAERFETLRGLYDRGLLTEEEYAEKRRALLEEL